MNGPSSSGEKMRPTLRAMGHGERHLLLRQLALSMLHEGEHHELITLLKARGASSNPLLAGMLADALERVQFELFSRL